jgi:hypothetical protein
MIVVWFPDCKSRRAVILKDVSGKSPLDAKNLKKFRQIVELYKEDIVKKWIDFFVYNAEIKSEKITKKI